MNKKNIITVGFILMMPLGLFLNLVASTSIHTEPIKTICLLLGWVIAVLGVIFLFNTGNTKK